jgi:hypothetical protein
MPQLPLRRAVWIVAGLGVVGSACTSILGDFSSGPGTSPDASTEGGVIDSGMFEATSPGDSGLGPADSGASDASGDAADSGLLTCTTWKWPQPLVVESLESAASRRFTTNVITAFPTKSGTLRIIAAKSTATLFSVYTVDAITMSVTQVDVPGATDDTVLGIWRDRGAGASLTAVVDRVSGSMPPASFNVHVIPDTMGSSGPVPAGFSLYQPTSSQTVTSMTVAPQASTNVFEAVEVSSGGAYTLGVGDVSSTTDPTTLGTVATAITAAPFNGPHLYQVANGDIYLYNENDPSTPGFTSWAVPPTGNIDGGVTPLLVESGRLSGVVDIAPNTTQASADVLTYEIIKSGNLVDTYNLRLGVVPNASLGSWSATSLPVLGNGDAGTYTRVQNAPVLSGNQMFWGDDILLLGQGYCILQPDGGGCANSPGMSAVWLNAITGLRSQEIASNRLLTTSTGNFFDAFSVPESITATSASWYVVWGEHQDDEAGAYDVLYMNILQCQ